MLNLIRVLPLSNVRELLSRNFGDFAIRASAEMNSGGAGGGRGAASSAASPGRFSPSAADAMSPLGLAAPPGSGASRDVRALRSRGGLDERFDLWEDGRSAIGELLPGGGARH